MGYGNCSTHMIQIVSMMLLMGCGGQPQAPETNETTVSKKKEERMMTMKVEQFLEEYQARFAELEQQSSLMYWTAANSGKASDFDAYAKADLALKTFHSDKNIFETISNYLKRGKITDPLIKRQLEVAVFDSKGFQLPKETIEEMVAAQSEIEQSFNTFRGRLAGEEMTNNALLEKLKDENDGNSRKQIWEALKQVGAEVSDSLIALAKLRNDAAKSLGYNNYFEMEIYLQEHHPEQLLSIFEELETLTDKPYSEMKATLDAELAERFGVSINEIRPWHYDNPFFQAAPPSKAVDPDLFYDGLKKEEIMPIAAAFFQSINLSVDSVIEKSDLYEREGKDQHAFCISIDKKKDVRTLLNITPTASWMDTSLHEEGHAAYYINIDNNLPFNLREAAHIFTTEAIAMLFGALAYNPTWLAEFTKANQKELEKFREPMLEQRRREQLIFARWAMVMFYFEREFYRDPAQDLNALWWDMVERFQKIHRPENRNAPDWASKPHFTIAPVYYHNYLLGEVFAAQLRHTLVKLSGHQGPSSTLSFKGKQEFGAFFVNKIFAPGRLKPWPEFVTLATGEPLTAAYFASEVAP